MKIFKTIACAVPLLAAAPASAECVSGALGKDTFVVMDPRTIILTGGSDRAILIRSFDAFHPSFDVRVLKDSFCSGDEDVLSVNGRASGVDEVTRIDMPRPRQQ